MFEVKERKGKMIELHPNQQRLQRMNYYQYLWSLILSGTSQDIAHLQNLDGIQIQSIVLNHSVLNVSVTQKIVMNQLEQKMQMREANIEGINFSGKAKLFENSLKLELFGFKNGKLYNIYISTQSMEKDQRRFLIFKQKQDLFEELLVNNKVEISDQDNLLIPITVNYKGKQFDLTVQVPLQACSKDDKYSHLLEEVDRISQKLQIRLNQNIFEAPQQIKFKGDPTNLNYKMFEVKGSTVRMLGKNRALSFNHCQSLSMKGTYYFQFKVLRTKSKFITFGICAESVKSIVDASQNPLYMGFCLFNNCLYSNGKQSEINSPFELVVGQSIIKAKIDMGKKRLYLVLSNGSASTVHSFSFGTKLRRVEVYPFVGLYHEGDTVQILSMQQ